MQWWGGAGKVAKVAQRCSPAGGEEWDAGIPQSILTAPLQQRDGAVIISATYRLEGDAALLWQGTAWISIVAPTPHLRLWCGPNRLPLLLQEMDLCPGLYTSQTSASAPRPGTSSASPLNAFLEPFKRETPVPYTSRVLLGINLVCF